MDALLNATLIAAIAGLIALTYASETIHPPVTHLADLSTEDTGTSIRVDAEVRNTHRFDGGSMLLTLGDNKTTLKAYLPYHTATRIAKTHDNLTACRLELTGDLAVYRGELELVVEDADAVRIRACP